MLNATAVAFLLKFYEDRTPYVVADDATTTWESVGALFVTIAVTQTTKLESLTKLTGFPRAFVLNAIAMIEQNSWLLSPDFAELVMSIHDQHGTSFADVNRALESLMSSFWGLSDYHQLSILELLREGRVFGGFIQWWTDEEGPVALRFIFPQSA